jgi:hypothetical protein
MKEKNEHMPKTDQGSYMTVHPGRKETGEQFCWLKFQSLVFKKKKKKYTHIPLHTQHTVRVKTSTLIIKYKQNHKI